MSSPPRWFANIYKHTDAVGFVGASSIERIPVERAVTGIVQEFKNIPLKNL